MGISIMMKPQGIIFGPVLLFEVLRTKDIKVILKSVAIGAGTVLVIAMPFTIGNSNPLWMYDLFFKMTDTWKFTSTNAFNFWTLLGTNWKEDYNIFIIFTYKTWGDIFIFLTVALTAFTYWKSKNNFTLFFGALILDAGTFNLSTRMHERYLYPVIFVAIFIYIFLKDKRALALVYCSNRNEFPEYILIIHICSIKWRY